MPSASRYERELIAWASQRGLVARLAASGTLNTIVGDLLVIPTRESKSEPLIIEVKSTHSPVYYTSRHYRQLYLLQQLSKVMLYKPILAVRFIGHGWKIIDISDEIPVKVTPEGSVFYTDLVRLTVDDWAKLKNE